MAGSKVRIRVFNLDGRTSKTRMYPRVQLQSALLEVAENVAEQCPTHRYEQVAVTGGYNFVCRGRVKP